jgi:putative cardiolipin synthase
LFIGSFNFDQRSMHINNEIGLLFEQPDAAAPVSDEFNRNIEEKAFKVELHYEDDGREPLRWRGLQDGKEVVFISEPYAGLGTQIAAWLMKILPIESQL